MSKSLNSLKRVVTLGILHGDYCRAEVTKVDTRSLDNGLHREPSC